MIKLGLSEGEILEVCSRSGKKVYLQKK